MPNNNPPTNPGPLAVNIQLTGDNHNQLGWNPDSLTVTNTSDVVVTFNLVNSPGAVLKEIKFTGSMQAQRVSDTQWQTTSYNPKAHKGKNPYTISVKSPTGQMIVSDPDVNNEPPGGPADETGLDEGGDEQGGGSGNAQNEKKTT
ncbi:MAG TPA: hypothetical protein VJ276_05955 [Thermoanaerobaculia bacterium]|nr:hypothetical protein [Thermoanaerobaculia bacterium]